MQNATIARRIPAASLPPRTRRLLRQGLALLLSALPGLGACAAEETASLPQLLQWISGDFDNLRQVREQAPDDSTFSHLGLQRRLVDAPLLAGPGEHVVYAQINRRADPADVYRQSLMIFSLDDDGRIIAQNYRFRDEAAQRDILAHPERFAALERHDIVPALPAGCEPQWTFDGREYRSRIDRGNCVMISRRDGQPRHIQATEYVGEKRIRNEESGYRADGSIIFGVPGDRLYHYDRVAPAPRP